MKNKLIQIFIVVTTIISVALFFSVKTNSNSVFPISESNNKVHFQTYHETLDSGYSTSFAAIPESEEALVFAYSLSQDKSILEPFSALFFYRKDSVQPFFDLTEFSTITLNLNAFRGKRIPITLTLNYEGFTDKDKLLSNLPLTYLLDYERARDYNIALEDFEIPSWWLREHNLKKEDLVNIDFARVNYIVIGSCQLLERGVEDKITIANIKFYSDNSTKFYLFGIFWLVCGASLYIFSLIKRKKIVVPYSKVTIQERYGDASTKVEAVVNYVANHFSDPELSLSQIERAIGISSREIGTIFKIEFESSFKKYLNLVRLTEVKRLLLETDQTISVIAYNTGYSNVSHFNRVFKSEEGVSPKDYREKSR
jgi:AraC-like DNA-binding protein